MTVSDRKAAESMLSFCDKIQRTVKRVGSYDAFVNDDEAGDVSIARIEQIGEIAKRRLSDSFKSSLDKFNWYEIYGLRNRIVHDYDSLNLVIIWEVMTDNIPELAEALRTKLAQEGDGHIGPLRLF